MLLFRYGVTGVVGFVDAWRGHRIVDTKRPVRRDEYDRIARRVLRRRNAAARRELTIVNARE